MWNKFSILLFIHAISFAQNEQHDCQNAGLSNLLSKVTASADLKKIILSYVGQAWKKARTLNYSSDQGLTERIRCMAFTADNKFLICGKHATTVIRRHNMLIDHKILNMWDCTRGKMVRASSDDQSHSLGATGRSYITTITFSRDNKYVAIDYNLYTSILRTEDITNGNRSASFNNISALVFSHDSNTLALGSPSGSIKILKIAGFKLAYTLANDGPVVIALAYSPDGSRLVSARGSAVEIWDIQTQKMITTLRQHNEPVEVLAYSLDGKYLASGSADSTIVWDAQSLQVIDIVADNQWHDEKPKTAIRYIKNLFFSSDSNSLIAGTSDNIKIWDIKSLGLQQIIALPGSKLAGSPDGQLLASTDESRQKVILWSLQPDVICNCKDEFSCVIS